MDNKELKKIKVIVDGRSFPLKVEESNETAIVAAVKELNSRINQYQLKFKGKPKEEILSMVLLTYAVDLQDAHGQESDTSVFQAKLEEIDQLLDATL